MRRAFGPILAALATGLLLSTSAVAFAANGSGRSAADAIAAAGAVTASRAEVGSCVTLTGGGFVPSQQVSVVDDGAAVRTVHANSSGQIAAGVCFNGSASPGLHTLTATGSKISGHVRSVTSDVWVVGASQVARPPHQSNAAGHTRLVSVVVACLLVGVPLVVLVVTLTMLVRAAGRVRGRRRLKRQAAEASLLLDNTPSAAPSRRRAVVIPLLAGLAVAVLLALAYGAARVTDLVHQVQHSTDDLASAVRHLQVGDSSGADVRAQRAVDAAAAARRDDNDPVVRVLSRLPGLRVLGDALRVERRVVSSAAISVGSSAADQKSSAAVATSQLAAVRDTGWSQIDDRVDGLRSTVAALGGQAQARVAADELRGPMLRAGRQYLLLVQNDHQARATGGVITTHAVMRAGAHSLSFTSVSHSDRSWQAINLTPDFPAVASAAASLWERQGGQHMDGVVALDDVALTRLGADPNATPLNQLRTAFDALRAATRTSIGFDATIVTAASGGHVQLWSAHPDEETLLSTLSVGGAVGGRPANSFQVLTESLDDGTGSDDAGQIHRDVSYAWRPTLRRDDLGDGLQLVNAAGVDVRLTNTSAAPQATWVLLYVPGGTGFTHAGLDGKPVALHTSQDHGFEVLSTVVTVPANGSTLLSVEMVSPTPGGPPVYISQPREAPDVAAVTRV